MKIVVVVDANVILSALIGGKAAEIFFDGRYNFVTTEFTIKEVRKYLPKLSKKLGISQKLFNSLLRDLPLSVKKKGFYQKNIKKSISLISHIDKKDVEILALALRYEAHLWSQDKHFDKCEYQKILKTFDFL